MRLDTSKILRHFSSDDEEFFRFILRSLMESPYLLDAIHDKLPSIGKAGNLVYLVINLLKLVNSIKTMARIETFDTNLAITRLYYVIKALKRINRMYVL